jgi:hypothetical protein
MYFVVEKHNNHSSVISLKCFLKTTVLNVEFVNDWL